ncbi:hypothetical protein OA238_c37110 [Octadecabacter arcticus 238]|uniref:50S ribosomal protein L35 n=1 Tax=Octadecabacter arcticus 238 TaxID=391616 RepID=M9RUX8_9RHOB|nr:hypothetical protein [Octadecabacter arcticus]AGI73660.1 hypothetical protein OA238_c37110 [Octadecabacter arcticus 238]
MDPDLLIVIGLVVGGFSIPSILGAIADGRVPRAAAIAVMVAGGLIALAINENPDGYAINDIPDVFVNVVERYIN